MCIALAVALNTAMEMLSRRSVWEGVQFLALHPVHFLCNILVVLLTLLLALLVKRRVFMLSLVSTIWLGLAIAKQIIESHRGKIWIKSEKGEGTEVFLYLPLRQESGM